MWIYIIIAIVLIIVMYVLITYNSFIKLKNMVQEAFSTMDVYLKKRWDLIPNLIETVKGYVKHEENTLKEIVDLRGNSYDSMSDDEKVKANQTISKDINKIMLVAENYPDLKASVNFQDLSRELSKVEEDIANARKYYNGAVEMFNNKVEMFPSNILAKLFGYKPKAMFETDNNERENVKVSF